jgi:peptidoglycan/xylan/chitin deacetylase (PgdA/CDA1 family)
MKWWRQLRAFARATLHTSLVLVPLCFALTAHLPWLRLVAVLGTGVGVALLVRAAFIYVPGFDPFFRVPWRGPRAGRRIAITFDDGPNGAATEAVLDLFAKHGARATFFMVGKNVEAQPELARRVAAAGHAVGSHTYSHQKLSRVPLATVIAEVDRGHQCLVDAGLPAPKLFRAPHGLKTFGLVRHLDRRGIQAIAWTAGLYDTDCPSADIIARRAVRWTRPGVILLLHDGKLGHDRSPMLGALDRILTMCRERNLTPVTVPELLGEMRS